MMGDVERCGSWSSLSLEIDDCSVKVAYLPYRCQGDLNGWTKCCLMLLLMSDGSLSSPGVAGGGF